MRYKTLLMAVATAATLTAVSSLPAAEVFLLDFGGDGTTTGSGAAPNDPVNAWNNIPESVALNNTGLHAGLITIDSTATTIGLQMTRRFGGVNGNGTQSSGLLPINATRDSLYGNTGEFQGLSNIFPQFKLTNLDPNSAYSFTFYASRTGVGDNRETQYDVEGLNAAVAYLNASNNIDSTATVTGITPDINNEILISLSPGSNNNNGATRFTYLGVLRIEATQVPEPTTAALALAGLLAVARRRRTC